MHMLQVRVADCCSAIDVPLKYGGPTITTVGNAVEKNDLTKKYVCNLGIIVVKTDASSTLTSDCCAPNLQYCDQCGTITYHPQKGTAKIVCDFANGPGFVTPPGSSNCTSDPLPCP